MYLCGIEIKSNQVIVVVVKDNEFWELDEKKIELENDEDQNSIREFCNDFLIFLKKNNIEKVYIKKRAKKGTFAGGAVTFKIEGLIQLNPHCEVELVSAQTINAFKKRNEIVFPKKLNKYQQEAYLCVKSSI